MSMLRFSRQSTLLALIVGLSSLLSLHTMQARAATLNIVATHHYEADQGPGVRVVIQASGLGNLSAPSLAAFGLELFYSPQILTLRTVQFWPYLGDPRIDLYTCSCAFQGWPVLPALRFPTGDQAVTHAGQAAFPPDAVPTSLALNLSETSLLGIALDGAQPAAFSLLTLDFGVRSSGVTQLGVFVNQFSDVAGNSIPITNAIDVLGRSFVRGPDVHVSEPSSIIMFAMALLLLSRLAPCSLRSLGLSVRNLQTARMRSAAAQVLRP